MSDDLQQPSPYSDHLPHLVIIVTPLGAQALVSEIDRVQALASADVKGPLCSKIPALLSLRARLLDDPRYEPSAPTPPPPPKEAA